MLSIAFAALSVATFAVIVAHSLPEPRACKLIVATKEISKTAIVAQPSRYGYRRHIGGDERKIVPDPNIIQEQDLIRVGPRIVRYEDLFQSKVIITNEGITVGKADLNQNAAPPLFSGRP